MGINKVPKPKKYRSLSGKITNNLDPNYQQPLTWDQQVWNMAFGAPSTAITSNNESNIEDRMTALIVEKNKDIECLITEAGIRAMEDQQNLSDIGLELLVKLYCSRGQNFDEEKFTSKLEKMRVSFLTANKVYLILEKWRNDCTVSVTTHHTTVSGSLFTPAEIEGPMAVSTSGPSSSHHAVHLGNELGNNLSESEKDSESDSDSDSESESESESSDSTESSG